MSKIKIFVLGLFLILLCGCESKFEGTWCLYNEVASSLIIINSNASNTDFDNLTSYLNSIKEITSYDIIDGIESADKMINIYYNSKDKAEEYKEKLSKYKAVKSIENKMLNKADEKIVIRDKNYTYGKNLSGLAAKETKGTIKTKGNEVTICNNTFYYKDSFLCKDKECSVIFTKSNKDCNN